jgi:hypothetical protein
VSGASAASDCVSSSHASDGKAPPALRNTARIVAVRLVDCAFNTAFMCRVSTQITGKLASVSTLKSHCDSDPAILEAVITDLVSPSA